jgi:uracil-DNA glycosylase
MEQIPDKIHESWHPYLQKLFDDPKMKMLKYDILMKTRFYPKPEDMFNVFKMPLQAIKVVILGQDPYINKGEAIGYAFAIPPTTKTTPTLRTIKEEIVDTRVERLASVSIDSPEWKELKHWRQQGIFLLNSALTVKVGESATHLGYWSWFTREIMKTISLHSDKKPVWLLWGAKAKAFKGFIHNYYGWNNKYMGDDYNYVLEANHPAADSHPDSHYKFRGCNHFSLTNEILKYKKETIINW